MPNLLIDLLSSKHSFIHEEYVRLASPTGLQKSGKGYHTTRVLTAKLAIAKLDVNSQYALLYAPFLIELS